MKKSSNKNHVSTFFVTVNTNQTDVQHITSLREAFNMFYSNIKNFIKLLGKEDLSFIDKIICESAIEIGSEKHRVHLHSLIKINHRTKIQLDQAKMRIFFQEMMDLPSIHLN